MPEGDYVHQQESCAGQEKEAQVAPCGFCTDIAGINLLENQEHEGREHGDHEGIRHTPEPDSQSKGDVDGSLSADATCPGQVTFLEVFKKRHTLDAAVKEGVITVGIMDFTENGKGR